MLFVGKNGQSGQVKISCVVFVVVVVVVVVGKRYYRYTVYFSPHKPNQLQQFFSSSPDRLQDEDEPASTS